MKVKRILATLCAAALCAAPLAGCGGGDGGGDWWSTTGELTFDEDGNVVFKNQSVKLVTVVSGEDVSAFQDIVDQFNAEYNGKIRITVDNVSQTEFENNIATRITQNYQAPDLIMSHQKEHRSYVDNHLVQPFETEIMEQSKIIIDLNEYSTGLAQYASAGYDDVIYSIPCDAQSMAVFYNRDLLRELGEVDEGGNDILPTNHDELLAVCKKFADKYGTSAISWTTTTEHFYNYVFTSAIIQNGGSLYNDDTKHAEWTAAGNYEAFEKAINSLRDLIYPSDSATAYAPFKVDDTSSLSAFVNKEALFYLYLPWRINSLTSAYENEWGIAEDDITNHIGATTMANWFAVKGEGETDYPETSNKIFVDSHFFAMSRTVTDINKKAAILEFIKWFTQTTEVSKMWAQAGHITAYKPVAADTEYQNYSYYKNYIQKFYPDINNFVCMGNTPYSTDMISIIKSLGYDAFAYSSVDIRTLVSSKQKELNNAIELIETLG